MKKQRYCCNFLKLEREIYEKLRDCYLEHSKIELLRKDPIDFIVNFKRYTKDIPEDFKSEILSIAKSLIKRQSVAS